MNIKYKIPNEFFFRLHHVRPRFKNDVEEVLLYVASSIADLQKQSKKEFNNSLNSILFEFKKNKQSTQKTIDNWRTEISALFGFVQKQHQNLLSSKTVKRLASNQYLDEFFNYFLYTFQYPGGHIKPQNIVKQINAGIKFKPCQFILKLLIAGEKITKKPFYITAEELTQCAFFDLRVTKEHRKPQEVAKLIISNRISKIEYEHKYHQLYNSKTQNYPSKGDVYRYAGDILDYMVLANLLKTKGTGYYYYLNNENALAIDYHLKSNSWFRNYDKFYNKNLITNQEISLIETDWFDYVNSFDEILAFAPQLSTQELARIRVTIGEYYAQLKNKQNAPAKIIGDYGETLVLAHEYLRMKNKSNRTHLINKIPTHLGVGYDLQSIETDKLKRYIEVKTSKSKKAILHNRFKITPNEWDSAETLQEHYFIYYLTINDKSKNIFMIQNPYKQYQLGNLKVSKDLIVEFNQQAGIWHELQQTNH